MKDWHNKTCKDCIYRDESFCRRFPPTNVWADENMHDYPIVSMSSKYKPACAEHAKEAK